MGKIKALIMDVDGTLTDGSIYMGNTGELMKCFNVKDGYAIHNMLPMNGITPIIITGRDSTILKLRCDELGIKTLIQGSANKVQDMMMCSKKMNISLSEIAYIGDDINDLDAMKLVGLRGCPADAVNEVKSICEFISNNEGGKGAVREFVEWILER